MTAVLVFLGAAVGAPLRYLADRAVQSRHDSVFPWGTLSVNLAGSLALGGLLGAGTALPSGLAAVLGAGLAGALTTYSTLSYETVRLAEDGAWCYATANMLVSVGAGIAAGLLGHTVVNAFV